MIKWVFIFLTLLISGFVLFHDALAECLSGQIDVNQASVEDLDKITQVGPTLAARIITEREISPFVSLDDLLRIKGIGDATLAKIKTEGLACISSTNSGGGSTDTSGETNATSTKTEDSSLSNATSSSSTSETFIFPNHQPIAEAGDNVITNIGALVRFDGSASSDQDSGDTLSYFWNLGDGNSRNATSFDYAYQLSGKYVVVLEVSDQHLTDIDTIIVEVYPQAVFISEFLPNPEGSDTPSKGSESATTTEPIETGEWIEIGNLSDKVVDVSLWQIDDDEGGSKPFVLPDNSLILPQSFLVFDRATTKIALNNNNDKVRLLYPSGIVADEISYENAKDGLSAARKGNQFFWTKVLTSGLKNLIFLDKEIANKTEAKDAITVGANTINGDKTIKNLLAADYGTVVSPKSNLKSTLVNSKSYQVSLPTLADLDDILTIKETFAKNGDSGKINGENIDNQRLSINSKNNPSHSPEMTLLLAGLASASIFGIWGVVLKRRFFS